MRGVPPDARLETHPDGIWRQFRRGCVVGGNLCFRASVSWGDPSGGGEGCPDVLASRSGQVRGVTGLRSSVRARRAGRWERSVGSGPG